MKKIKDIVAPFAAGRCEDRFGVRTGNLGPSAGDGEAAAMLLLWNFPLFGETPERLDERVDERTKHFRGVGAFTAFGPKVLLVAIQTVFR